MLLLQVILQKLFIRLELVVLDPHLLSSQHVLPLLHYGFGRLGAVKYDKRDPFWTACAAINNDLHLEKSTRVPSMYAKQGQVGSRTMSVAANNKGLPRYL